MAQVIFIHAREDRDSANFLLRAFANTGVKPLVMECADDALIFVPGTNFEQTVNNSVAVFILFTAAMGNNNHLKNQVEAVCAYAAGKEVWIFEPADQLGKITAKIKNFKHYARFEESDGWLSYLQTAIKYYDDSDMNTLLATTTAGGALIAQKDAFAGGVSGFLLGLVLLGLKKSQQQEFGQLTMCRNCGKTTRLHLTQGTVEYRCVMCGVFCLKPDSPVLRLLKRGSDTVNPPKLNLQTQNIVMTESIKTPKAFISYSWDSEDHRNWVRELASRLRQEGIDVMLDQWHLAPGDPLPEFMERAVRENDFVILVCTPNFRVKADERKGGVGYEGNIMTGELFIKYNHRKFIPVLRHDSWEEAAPSWLQAKRYLDLTDPRFGENFEKLVQTLHGEQPEIPPLGKRTRKPTVEAPVVSAPGKAEAKKPAPKPARAAATSEMPIKITGIIPEEITKPRMDSTRGSGLYAVPFRLSARPSKEWAQLFVQNWNNPPVFTTMHRSKIARVSGDKIILDGTTIEEVEKYHRATLLAVIEKTNQRYGEYQAEKERVAEQKRRTEQDHEKGIDDVLKRIRFDD